MEALVEEYDWEGLGDRVAIKCFLHDPSLGSSLTFLRKTPWARKKVEKLYILLQHDQAELRELEAAEREIAAAEQARSLAEHDHLPVEEADDLGDRVC